MIFKFCKIKGYVKLRLQMHFPIEVSPILDRVSQETFKLQQRTREVPCYKQDPSVNRLKHAKSNGLGKQDVKYVSGYDYIIVKMERFHDTMELSYAVT